MVDPTRDAAYLLVSAVLERNRTLDDALQTLPSIAPRDRAAAHRLAASVLRRRGTLDAVIDHFIAKAPPPAVRHVLRIGAAGLLLLDTPPHAAVATAVALVRAQGLPKFAALVNAVLRRVADAGASMLPGLDSPRLDTPAWLWASWGERARRIATAHQNEAPLDLTLKPGAVAPPGAVMLPIGGSVRFPPGTRVAELEGFAEGAFWVQDAAAAVPARLLAARPGERVADLCAAPGGKTAQLAAAGAVVTSVDRNPARLARLRDNLARLGLSAELVAADIATWRPSQPFDAILLDAPCSATGTIRRHPDVLHLRKPSDIPALVRAQDSLLAAAAGMLRPGGRLVYAVCALQPEEGAPRVAQACEAAGPVHDPFLPGELAAFPEALTPDGFFRTDPGMLAELGGMDGFFAARLVKP